MTVLRLRPSFTVKFCGFETVSKQIADHVVCEKLHAAVGMVDDKPLASSQQLVRDDERANGVVGRAPTGISNDVGVTFR